MLKVPLQSERKFLNIQPFTTSKCHTVLSIGQQFFFRPWTMNVTSPSSDFEAPKDPGAQKSYTSVTDNEILGKLSRNFKEFLLKMNSLTP